MNKTLQLAQQLAAIPLRSPAVRVIRQEQGAMDLAVDIQRKGWFPFRRKATKDVVTKHYQLEGVGAEVFSAIDGKKTFEQLADILCARYKLTFFEGRGLLMQYYRTLLERGLILVELPREGS